MLRTNNNKSILGFYKRPPPSDVEYFSKGCYYKVGTHGFVYRWNDYEWMKSSVDLYDLVNEIEVK